MKLIERENEVLGTLEELPSSVENFIVVGGYAVSALARHRFSVDCDLVVRERDIGRIEAVLRTRGFLRAQEQAGFDKMYAGRFVRYVRKIDGLPVSFDLLVGSLVCRDTEASWSFDYVLSHSVETSIPGILAPTRYKIPSRELLLAFKLHSARKADVRDVVMLSEDANWHEVLGHLNRGNPLKLRASLSRVLTDLEDPRLANSLKGAFSLKNGVKATIEKTRDRVERIASELEESDDPG